MEDRNAPRLGHPRPHKTAADSKHASSLTLRAHAWAKPTWVDSTPTHIALCFVLPVAYSNPGWWQREHTAECGLQGEGHHQYLWGWSQPMSASPMHRLRGGEKTRVCCQLPSNEVGGDRSAECSCPPLDSSVAASQSINRVLFVLFVMP